MFIFICLSLEVAPISLSILLQDYRSSLSKCFLSNSFLFFIYLLLDFFYCCYIFVYLQYLIKTYSINFFPKFEDNISTISFIGNLIDYCSWEKTSSIYFYSWLNTIIGNTSRNIYVVCRSYRRVYAKPANLQYHS